MQRRALPLPYPSSIPDDLHSHLADALQLDGAGPVVRQRLCLLAQRYIRCLQRRARPGNGVPEGAGLQRSVSIVGQGLYARTERATSNSTLHPGLHQAVGTPRVVTLWLYALQAARSHAAEEARPGC